MLSADARRQFPCDGPSMAADLNQETLAADLERARLEHRARRLEAAVRALKDRVHGGRPVPRALTQALTEFQSELRSVRARLGR
jgi:hypothetical protein